MADVGERDREVGFGVARVTNVIGNAKGASFQTRPFHMSSSFGSANLRTRIRREEADRQVARSTQARRSVENRRD